MIIEVAKAKFLQEHTDRKRSPRKFAEGFSLRIENIEEGSAVAILQLSRFNGSQTLFEQDLNYFEDARDSIISAIKAAERNEDVTHFLPQKCLGYFDRLGRSLREDEHIELAPPNRQEERARFTPAIRRKLVELSQIREFTEEVELRGRISEMDQDNMTFQLQLIKGQKIAAPIPPQHFDTVLAAFNAYQDNALVWIKGIGRYDRNKKLTRLDSMEHIEILDPLDVSARLEEIQQLRDGWHEGNGTAPPLEGLKWLDRQMAEKYPDDMPLPYIYPTPNGGIRFEWTLGNLDISLDIDLVNKTAWAHLLDLDTDEEEEKNLNLADDEAWEWLKNRLMQIENRDND